MPILPQQMAAGSATPGTPDKDQIEQMREALLRHFIDKIHGPEPTPPLYQSQQLSPFQAYAQARNPQMAGVLEQQYQAPAQARYAQQQAAFEAAIAGRKTAEAGATNLLGQYGHQQMNPLDVARYAETVRHNKATEAAAAAARNEPERGVIQPDVSGNLVVIDPRTGKSFPVTDRSGAPVKGKKSAAEEAMRNGLDAAEDTLNQMEALFAVASQEQAPATRGISELGTNIPLVRSMVGWMNPLVREHDALRNKLVLQLNKPVSGQARLLQSEIQQLLKYVPQFSDNPKAAEFLFADAHRTIDRLRQKYSQTPNINAPAEATAPISGKMLADEYMRRYGPPKGQ